MAPALLEELASSIRELESSILEKKVVTRVDSEYYEVVAEVLGQLLGKAVWLSIGRDRDEGNCVSSRKIFTVEVEDTFDLDSYLELGLTRVERVWNEGEISILGDVVVMWPFSMKNLVRLSLLGKQIESIDIVESTSRKRIESVKKKTIIDSSSSLLVGNEDASNSVNISVDEEIGGDSDGVGLGIRNIPGIEVYSSKKAILEILRNFKTRGYKILYVSNSINRYQEDVDKSLKKQIDEIYEVKGEYANLFRRGFVFTAGKIVLLTDLEVLGEIDLSEFWERNSSMDPGSVEILKKIIPGDYVVHTDHGIGRYVDVQVREGGYYIQIAYAGKDRLYVPLTASEKITKYIGAGKGKPVLTGLNSGVWKRISKNAKEKAEDIAKELLQLYAVRETVSITPCLSEESDLSEFDSFVSKFRFRDTDDQLLATQHLVKDLQSGKPMDRLLVGDVGYGKTEIAMRAIFAVVNAGYQVAFLAPTTILVEQHLSVLAERFNEYFFNVSSLSRMTPAEEKESVIVGLEKGSVDIVVGTHSLLSESIKFKNLGLLVVDEEQKFGVKQKEKIKGRKLNCNVLSLTATPIPRTLNMALLGIRDISVLATPPSGRLEIKNTFSRFNWESVGEAIKNELDRGGQVYYLHNRVETIDAVFEKLNNMFPQANTTIVHGQMNVQTLSKNMSDFIKGKSKILLCTTIIENGLDITSVNTLVVDDATMLGLSQMYQIRGRVGRSEKQAYAHFFYDTLKGDSALRISALKNSQELGSGFLLSNRDLEIRGSGDILGKNQSGTINSVGYGLYSQLLGEAVEKLKSLGK